MSNQVIIEYIAIAILYGVQPLAGEAFSFDHRTGDEAQGNYSRFTVDLTQQQINAAYALEIR